MGGRPPPPPPHRVVWAYGWAASSAFTPYIHVQQGRWRRVGGGGARPLVSGLVGGRPPPPPSPPSPPPPPPPPPPSPGISRP